MEELDIRGVPTRVWKNAPPSLRTVIDMSLGHGDNVFLVYEDERTTFAEHYRIACTLAHRLRTTFGIEQGDRVAIIMRNLPEWVMAFWGATLAGAIVVPLNAWWSGEELRYGLEDSGSKVAFVDTERVERIRPFLGGLPDLSAVIVADEHRREPAGPLVVSEPSEGAPVPEWPFALALGDVDEAASPPDLTIDPEDDATIFYTSGTTGRPKGAVGTHRNMGTNLMSLFFINTRGATRFGAPALETTGEKTQAAFLLSVPLFHATGCHSVMVSNLAAGGKLVMMHHFDPERALQLIERERIGTFGGVPAMVMQVLDSPDFDKYDTSSIRGVSYGGAPAPPDLVRRIRAAWPIGQPSNGYGLTETSSVTSMNSGGDYIAKPDSVGPAVPVCDVAVMPEDFPGDEPDGTVPRGPDVRGELWIKGPNVVRGYWNRPDETAKTFTRGLAPHGRRRPTRRRGLHLHRRPGQGHDHPGRRERVLGAGRGRPLRAPRRGRLRRHRRARSHARRGGGGRHRPAAGGQGDGGRAAGAREGAARRLHGADAHLVPFRAAAAQSAGKGPQARAARRAGGALGLSRRLREVGVEEGEGPGPGLVGRSLVVHGRRIPIAEGVACVVAVECHSGSARDGLLDLLDLLGRDVRVVAAVVEHAGALQRVHVAEQIVDARAVVTDGGVGSAAVDPAQRCRGEGQSATEAEPDGADLAGALPHRQEVGVGGLDVSHGSREVELLHDGEGVAQARFVLALEPGLDAPEHVRARAPRSPAAPASRPDPACCR